MRILVVDDSATVRRQVGQILAAAGHECDFAGNGIEAIELLLDHLRQATAAPARPRQGAETAPEKQFTPAKLAP